MTEILTKNDIIELQRHCYRQVETLEVAQGGETKTLLVGYQISPGSTFDISKFAQLLEEAVVDKLHMQGWLPRKPDGY
jgi:hypothetical protein